MHKLSFQWDPANADKHNPLRSTLRSAVLTHVKMTSQFPRCGKFVRQSAVQSPATSTGQLRHSTQTRGTPYQGYPLPPPSMITHHCRCRHHHHYHHHHHHLAPVGSLIATSWPPLHRCWCTPGFTTKNITWDTNMMKEPLQKLFSIDWGLRSSGEECWVCGLVSRGSGFAAFNLQ
jgi:hypothetical protein